MNIYCCPQTGFLNAGPETDLLVETDRFYQIPALWWDSTTDSSVEMVSPI